MSLNANGNTYEQSTSDIVSRYSSSIWATADVLRGVGAKASEWPNHMMPFFALMLVESRALRGREEALKNFGEFNPTDTYDVSDFKSSYMSISGASQSYHEDLLLHGQGLAHIVSGGPSGFTQRLRTYLNGYDPETRKLLGVNPGSSPKAYLNIDGAVRFLDGHGGENLWQYCKMWAQVDLVPYDSSAVTTLEEHIKRKWADISADTAGEHFTPADLIDLVGDLAKSYLINHPIDSPFLKIYDPTCGGGNMLFGTEHVLRNADEAGTLLNKDNKRYSIQIFGQELNDQLFALAAIEGRHKPHASIKEGNTLSDDQFHGEKFDLIVANPPYGTDWKQIQKLIEADTSGRFPSECRPSVSDGQHLFLQHIQSHLSDEGIAMVFCSGSTLFSGDAGGGESNARSKYILKDDGVLGIIQLPKNEFYNTGISTYLWIFVKGKPNYLQNKMFLLNAATLFSKMRKSLGNKNSEMVGRDRKKVVSLVEAVTKNGKDFDANREELSQDNMVMTVSVHNRMGGAGVVVGSASWGNPTLPQDQMVKMNAIHLKTIALKEASDMEPALLRWIDTQDIHYSKVSLELVRSNENGFLKEEINLSVRDFAVGSLSIGNGAEAEAVASIMTERLEREMLPNVKAVEKALKEYMDNEEEVVVTDEKGNVYTWGKETRNLSKNAKKLGRANLKFKLKPLGKKGEDIRVKFDVTLGPDIEKDTEVAPFRSDNTLQQQAIDTFLNKWVKDDYTITQVQTGCEINFNRLFPKMGERKTLVEINQAIKELDAQVALLHHGGV